MIGAKGDSFYTNGAVGRLISLPAMTKRHDRARTKARCIADLQQGFGYDETRQNGGLLLNWLHGAVHGVSARLDG